MQDLLVHIKRVSRVTKSPCYLRHVCPSVRVISLSITGSMFVNVLETCTKMDKMSGELHEDLSTFYTDGDTCIPTIQKKSL